MGTLLLRIRASAATLTSLVVLASVLTTALLRRARRPIEVARDEIALALNGNCRRVVEDGAVEARAIDLRPGEEILIEAGDVVPADATVTAGEGVLLPWLDAKIPLPVKEGATVIAGARLTEGRLRAVVGWSGDDRAFLRLTNDPRRRADLRRPARFGRLFAERASLLLTGLAALTAFAAGLDGVEILLVAVAVQAATAHAVTASVGALRVAATVHAALRRGIVFRSAEALDRAGHTTLAVFCARGTLLLGEPEVASIEGYGSTEPEEVLALVAASESGAPPDGERGCPARTAAPRPLCEVRAASRRDPPRSLRTAAVVVALAFVHEQGACGRRKRIQELESMGQMVLLVALAGRLVGLVGLQDGLRPGARAAVQHLLDAGLEPALLSGDARETCEALGRALAIDHVRPEVPPAERGDEIRRLWIGRADGRDRQAPRRRRSPPSGGGAHSAGSTGGLGGLRPTTCATPLFRSTPPRIACVRGASTWRSPRSRRSCSRRSPRSACCRRFGSPC